jgi:hypothetical protein
MLNDEIEKIIKLKKNNKIIRLESIWDIMKNSQPRLLGHADFIKKQIEKNNNGKFSIIQMCN